MHIFTLASGSAGNCTLVQDGETSLLIDAGISAKRICAGLNALGVSVDELSGILITHEHSDHISGLATLVKHHNIPILAPRTVANHLRYSIAGVDDYITELPVGEVSRIGGIYAVPFHTPHDTPESVGYRLEGANAIFGFCTDCGHVTGEMLEALRGADAAVVESNHDVEMLKAGSYPLPLKRRILSDNGHLSNDCCAALALEMLRHGTKSLVLGHISRENNTPELALRTVSAALSREGARVGHDVRVFTAPEREPLELCVKEDVPC